MVTIAIVLIHLAALAWVLIRRRGMAPVLIVNLLFGAAVLAFVVPYLPNELAYIRSGGASELFDYKNAIVTAFEIVTLLVSALAFRGALPAKIGAWIGFAGNFALSLFAVVFALTFKFTCCGYL
jgi:hypothetical protein